MKKRNVLVTCADRYMGPAISEKFSGEEFRLVRGQSPMTSEEDIHNLVLAAGSIDILIANKYFCCRWRIAITAPEI